MASLVVVPGYVFTAGVKPDVADFNAAANPSVSFGEGINADDIAAGSITSAKLSADVFSAMPTISALALDDKWVTYDASAGLNATITVANALAGIFSLGTAATAFTSFTADKVTFHNGTEARTMGVSRFFEQALLQATELTATADADGVLVADASEAAGSKVKLVAIENLLPDKATANTYASPTSLTIDAKGRVTSVTAGSSGVTSVRKYEASGALPTGSGDTNGVPITISPSFGASPSQTILELECTTADGDWVVGDIVPAHMTVLQTNTHPAIVVHRSTLANDALKIVRHSGTILMYAKDGLAAATFTPASWKYRLTVTRYG